MIATGEPVQEAGVRRACAIIMRMPERTGRPESAPRITETPNRRLPGAKEATDAAQQAAAQDAYAGAYGFAAALHCAMVCGSFPSPPARRRADRL